MDGFWENRALVMRTRPAESVAIPDAPEVTFRNEGKELVPGRLVSIRGRGVVVAYPSTGPVLAVGETAYNLKVTVGDRRYCLRRAKVTGMVNTGVEVLGELAYENGEVLIAEADEDGGEGWGRDFKGFLAAWQERFKVPREFQQAVMDLQSFLHDLKRWLEGMELRSREDPRALEELTRQMVGGEGETLLRIFDDLHARLEVSAEGISAADQILVFRFLRKHLQPYFLSSPFGYRTWVKPLGYPGDYDTVNMILRESVEGTSLFGRFMNWLLLRQPPSEAHRNRIAHLEERLVSETARVVREGRRARILSIGCGPAGEIQKFLESSPLGGKADFVLVDFNDETLDYARKALIRGDHYGAGGATFELVRESVVHLLKETNKIAVPGKKPEYDLVYCAGLLDYFHDRTSRQLVHAFYDWTRPGGLMLVTNVAVYRPFKYMLEAMLDWFLVYRNPAVLRAFVPDGVDQDAVRITSDSTSVNLILEVRKPPASGEG